MTQAAEIATMNNDANRPEQLEKVIATGLETFVAVGNALFGDQRQAALQIDTQGVLEDYCNQRWDMTRVNVYRIIHATEFAGNLLPTGLQNPKNERQIRPVLTLPKEEQVDAWEQAVRNAAPEGKVTAKHVENVVKERKAATTPQPPPRPYSECRRDADAKPGTDRRHAETVRRQRRAVCRSA